MKESAAVFPRSMAVLMVGVLTGALLLAIHGPGAMSRGLVGSSGIKAAPVHFPRGGMPQSAKQYYAHLWGIDEMSVKLAESGQLVRFSYRVTDATKAAPLHDRASNPNLYDEKSNAVLEVPVMEKVGPLRQSMPPQNGQSYWMVFSNKGGYVKQGHRVSVEIGPVRVDGLLVQ